MATVSRGYRGPGGWTSVTFTHTFSQTPAVLVQIQTLGAASLDANNGKERVKMYILVLVANLGILKV